MSLFKTEDQVRDDAKILLGFDKYQENVKQGTGQVTTFNQLGFKFDNNNKKPDGWYLPVSPNDVAIVLETKNSDQNLSKPQLINDLKLYIAILSQKYNKVIGILYNGIDIIVYKNNEIIETSEKLQSKEYYLSLFNLNKIDKQKIFRLTKRINDNLHVNFGMQNLYHRMIFTACALVAERYEARLQKVKDTNYPTFHTAIHSTLSKSLEKTRLQNQKLDLLLEVYAEIKMNNNDNQQAIDDFIDDIVDISKSVNSDYWNGEDVMAIFFNEFNRYRGKSEHGQIFTPDHITSLMYRLLEVNKNDTILDAACGSGAFLIKSMCNMIEEAGGNNTKEAIKIKSEQLYGIEFDRQIFALACANMLIHKDGKTNLEQLDTRTELACKWIESKPITKVLMNPPFERKYGCMAIVENVLNNVKAGTKCAFILPDKKFEKDSKGKKILKNNKINKIIKLPENVFSEGITTSIFIIEAGIPQGDNEIFTCYIKEDGLVTVKNQGRQDIKEQWQEIENYWINIIKKQHGDSTIQWINSKKYLSYQLEVKPFEVSKEDFKRTAMDYIMFKNNINKKDLNENLLDLAMYSSDIEVKEDKVILSLKKIDDVENKKNEF
jgi:type I restriction-modification system DNA methylase subunit